MHALVTDIVSGAIFTTPVIGRTKEFLYSFFNKICTFQLWVTSTTVDRDKALLPFSRSLAGATMKFQITVSGRPFELGRVNTKCAHLSALYHQTDQSLRFLATLKESRPSADTESLEKAEELEAFHCRRYIACRRTAPIVEPEKVRNLTKKNMTWYNTLWLYTQSFHLWCGEQNVGQQRMRSYKHRKVGEMVTNGVKISHVWHFWYSFFSTFSLRPEVCVRQRENSWEGCHVAVSHILGSLLHYRT